MLPTARGFSTRPSTGRYFSPALPSDCFAIDLPGRAICPSEGLPTPIPLFKGVAEAALYCAHRATTASSWGLCEQEGHLAAPFSSFLGRALREHWDRPSHPANFFSILLIENQKSALWIGRESRNLYDTSTEQHFNHSR